MSHATLSSLATLCLSRKVPTRDPPRRVLLAEDDDEMRALISWALRKHGYLVSEAGNGVEFLIKLGRGYGYFEGRRDSRFDAIVTDVRMPGLSGTDVLRTLSRRAFVETPVILITAFADDDLRAEARRLGVATVLSKPFLLEEVLDAVERALTQRDHDAKEDRCRTEGAHDDEA